ncbi:MAG: 30S ribosomal protein S2 [Bacteroidales bacterium]
MPRTNFDELLEAGVHFGHLKRKWNPAMAPYIFMERNGIHIIDLHKTIVKIEEAASALRQIARSGRKILFVATKKQAKDIVDEQISKINMPYVTERWPGGMLTNFPTIRKSVKKMSVIDKMEQDGTFNNLAKRERLHIMRHRAKLEKNFGSIADLTRLPAALFVVDVMKEYIAVREARRLNIPVFAIVDTNSDPNLVDFAIPANDDASKSISHIIGIMVKAIQEGLDERKMEKEKDASAKEKKQADTKDKSEPRRARARKSSSEGSSADKSDSAEKDRKPSRPRRKAPVAKSETTAEKVKSVEKSEEKGAGQAAETEEKKEIKEKE